MPQIALTGWCLPETSSVASFLTNAPEFLGALLCDRRLLRAVVDFSDSRYIQFSLDSPDHFLAEVESNAFIDEANRLTESDEVALLEMGWWAPSELTGPNWSRSFDRIEDLWVAVDMATRVICQVFRAPPESDVYITTFEAPPPDSPFYVANSAEFA